MCERNSQKFKDVACMGDILFLLSVQNMEQLRFMFMEGVG